MNKRFGLAERLLRDAEIELGEYKTKGEEAFLVQACEKGWDAVAQGLKAVNPEIKRHQDFGRTAARLAKEHNNPEIAVGELCGETLHRSGFYEGELPAEIVEEGLSCIRNFLGFIKDILLNGKKIGKFGIIK
ncbi:MAG: PaREP1 family protein [bacterium]